MSRIVYGIYSSGGLQGGHKMILRHVETLRELGFDAVAYTGTQNVLPAWFAHRAPLIVGDSLWPDQDVFVVPEDSLPAIPVVANLMPRRVVFSQNHFGHLADSYDALKVFAAGPPTPYLAASPSIARLLGKLYPTAQVHLVRAFADERLFRPADRRARAAAIVPRKRPLEAAAILNLFDRLHRDVGFDWRWLHGKPEAEVAEAFSDAAVMVSLNHLEGLGMTTLEAMAAGCLCAGFTGGGGLDYATPDNGFWVPDDDVEACVEALAEAAAIAVGGGPEHRRRQEAGFDTARAWSHAVFRAELEAAWMQLAPDARISSGPLEPARA